MASPLRLTLLGRPRLWIGGQEQALPQPKLLALLARLALEPSGLSREQLADLLWGSGKAQNVRQALYTLKALPDSYQWLDAGGATIHLNATCDVQDAEDALGQGDFQEALSHWSTADSALLSGLELPGAPAFMEWLQEERTRLRLLHQQALQTQVAALEAGGKSDEALGAARLLVEVEPLDESAHRLVIRLEALNGHPEAALAAFERCRQMLRTEFQLEPSEETLALLHADEQGQTSSGKQAYLVEQPTGLPVRPEAIYGREDALLQARSLLALHGQLLIQGLGGIGKTTLAAALTEDFDFGSGKVVWLELGDDSPDMALDALAFPLGARREVARGEPADRAAALRTALITERVRLVVLDDVWNAYTLSRIREAIPTEVQLIVTSRQRYPGLPRLSLARLERSASLELLAYHAPETNRYHPRTDALCALLGDHPYAVRLAAITLEQDRKQPIDLVAQLQASPHELGGPQGIRALFDLSLERLSDTAYEAFLGIGALFTPSCTPELLAFALRRSTEETELGLYELVERGLAVRQGILGQDLATFRVHDLAWSYGQVHRIIRRSSVIDAVEQYVQINMHQPDCLDAELPNVLGAFALLMKTQRDKKTIELALQLTVRASYTNARGASVALRDLIEGAIEAAERVDDQTALHDLWVKLGNSRRNLSGDLRSALEAYERALQYARSMNDRIRQAMTLSTVGRLYAKENPQKARECLMDALKLARGGGENGCLSLVLEGLGYMAGVQGDQLAAEQYFREAIQALNCVDSALDDTDLDRRRFFAISNLGEAQILLGKIKDGLSTKTDALKFAAERSYHLYEGHAHFDIGQILYSLGRFEEGETALEKALSCYSFIKSTKLKSEVEDFLKINSHELGPRTEKSGFIVN